MSKLVQEYEREYGSIPPGLFSRMEYIKSICKAKPGLYDDLDAEVERIKNVEWKSLHYTFYLVPKATPRPRLGAHGCFYVKGASANRAFFKEYVREMKIPMIKTPCKFYCTNYLPTPKSMSLVERMLAEMGFIYPISKPDFDNLVKSYTDMIQGTLLYDDSLIIEGTSKKRYSVKPRIEIRIEYMSDFDCRFNYKKMKDR